MKLVADWKIAHKWLSVRIAALAAGLQTGWLALPDAIKADLSPAVGKAVSYTVAILAAAVILGRVIDQGSTEETKENGPANS